MSSPPPPMPVTVVGLGADGWAGLSAAGRSALTSAEVLIGGPRQLDLLPAAECAGERVAWPSPLRPAVPKLMAEHAGRRIAVLASGDPMFYGIGRALAEELGPRSLRVHPHPSSVSYACARLGWPVEDTEVVTVVGRPVARLAAALHEGRRVLVLSAGAASPGEIAALLRERGFGPSRMRVLEQLGSEREDTYEGHADSWDHAPGDPLNVVALDCRRDPAHDAPRLGATPVSRTPRTNTTGSSPSAMSGPRPCARWPRPPASCCGTSAAAPAPSASSGCVRTPRAGRWPWSASRSGPGASPVTRRHSASPACAWSSAPHPRPWPDCRPPTPCSSAAG